ncbi:MAG: M48 family metallopeptidase [Deltaproteobacteria bacterium]|nr:M48 family metallopeptidase [Deltaproteobacteria bacterium]
MQSEFQCTLFLAGNPEGKPATVTVRANGFGVKHEGGTFEIPFHQTQASKGGYNDSMLVLSGPGPQGRVSLYFGDQGIVRAMSGYRLPPLLAAQLSGARGGGKGKWVLLVLLLLVGLGYGLYWLGAWGFGKVVDVAVQHVPAEWEVELGKQAATETLTQQRVCGNLEMNRAVNDIGSRLVAAVESPPYEFRIKVIDSPDVNAFALPGGYVFVNWGLLRKAASADEAAGVLAHEIQHALRRHGLRNVVGRASIALIVGLAVGDVQGVGGLAAGLASELAALSFSREQEEEADALGLDLVYRARFRPEGMPDFFLKMKEEEASRGMTLPSFLSTHPDTDARIEALKAEIVRRGEGMPEPFARDWAAAVASCDPVPLSDPDADVGTADAGEAEAEEKAGTRTADPGGKKEAADEAATAPSPPSTASRGR